ncbi:MAG: GGDEF domain-containing protein [Spirochaetales bacterium]|nr:GGDEF domain-containing protein [Spirochaetales bacterium]
MSTLINILYYLDKQIILDAEKDYSLGRAPENDIIFQEKTVSRRHARLRFNDGKWFLKDLDSANGTRINAQKIEEIRLQDGDRIQIGPFLSVYRAFSDDEKEMEEFNALLSDTLILEHKIQDILQTVPGTQGKDKIYDLKHFINSLRSKMDTLANIDKLTGLFNRRYFDQQLSLEIERTRRYKQNLFLIMIDIDHFKKFNDTYGHQKGDEVLAAVGAILKEHTRKSDVAVRYGGEEMAVILPQITDSQAKTAAEKIRREIEVLSKERTGLTVTASLGVSSSECSGFNPEKLIRNADSALYEAKKQGRNRVCMYKAKR